MGRHRSLGYAGGFARKTVSLPADTVQRVESFLESNNGMTFSGFVQDALDARLDLFKIKKVR